MNKQQFYRKIVGNEFVRIVAYPFIIIKHKKDQKSYEKSQYPEQIRKLKDKYIGERCFVVGNGPSLSIEDLNCLAERQEICFGMNHIYDLFNKTKWRPNFYFCFDRDFIRYEYKHIVSLPIDKIFIEYSKTPHCKIENPNHIFYYFSDYVYAIKRGTAITDHVCIDLEKKTSFVTNTTHLCIEFAIYMGFKEIYLIGVDHDYSFGYGMNHAVGINEGKHNDSKEYCTSDMNVSTQKYLQYRRYAEEKGIRIYNATKGGKLEVYERMHMEDVFA